MGNIDFALTTGDRNVCQAYLPQRPQGRLPVLIYCHGWGGSGQLPPLMLAVRERLLKVPAAIVSFDFFGCGKTGGDFSQMSYARWAANLADVYRYVAEQEWTDPARIGLLAVSSGTNAAFRFAATARPAFVISVATCLGLMMNMPNGPGKVMMENLQALLEGGRASVFSQPLSLKFFKDFIGHAPIYSLDQVRCPVLFLQGEADNPWRRSDAWLGWQVLLKQGTSVEHIEMSGGNHGLDNVAEKAADAAVQWLSETGIFSSGDSDWKIRLLCGTDSIDELTALLHRSYARLGDMGLNYTAVDQTADVTTRRVRSGICFVATSNGKLIGTIMVRPPRSDSYCPWYCRAGVATAGQFAVMPEYQNQGIGSALLEQAEKWAVEQGHQELALDTAEPAKHLVEFYVRRGYRRVADEQWSGKSYRSLILSKAITSSVTADSLEL